MATPSSNSDKTFQLPTFQMSEICIKGFTLGIIVVAVVFVTINILATKKQRTKIFPRPNSETISDSSSIKPLRRPDQKPI